MKMTVVSLAQPHQVFPTCLLILGLWSGGCGGDTGADEASHGGSHSLGGAAAGGELSGVGGAATGGASLGVGGMACSDPQLGALPHVAGCIDTHGCDTLNCHGENTGLSGGWLYNNLAGDYWVQHATVTIINPDGSVVTATTAADGFFSLIGDNTLVGTIGLPYIPCVSKCPDIICGSKAAHTAVDCQTANCHGAANRLIYLPGQDVGAGGSGGGGATDCAPPTLGGPRAHLPTTTDTQPCWYCHPGPDSPYYYTGGFVYDGLTSSQWVTQATVTVTPTGGTTQTAVSGLGGMFYFLGELTAPYTACVSKCPSATVCSGPETHTTAQGCWECHNETQRIHIP